MQIVTELTMCKLKAYELTVNYGGDMEERGPGSLNATK